MSDLDLIRRHMNDVTSLMGNAGFVSPLCEFQIRDSTTCRFTIWVCMKAHEDGDLVSNLISSEDVEEGFAEAREWVMSRDTPREIEEKELRQKLADTIDAARKLDMPFDFLNPLVEQMKILSENILTYTKENDNA